MQHQGEIIEKAVRASGYSITRLARKMGKTPRWLYYIFDNDTVPVDYMLQIGEIIHHDFTEEIESLKKYKAYTASQVVYEQLNAAQSGVHPDYWKNKYLHLLEQYNEMLRQFAKDNNLLDKK
jgi:plasmid maintenance system antidote protein VapI